MTCPEPCIAASILVVDDDPDIRDVLRMTLDMALEERAHHVATAADGKEALEILQTCTPCLVLLDLMMPVMSGAELLAVMRSDNRLRRVPVIIVSAWRKEAAAVEGAQGLLGKPLDLPQVMDVVGKYCP
jgi:CheY-like chemotaxis protein